jgi:hypothetical protein
VIYAKFVFGGTTVAAMRYNRVVSRPQVAVRTVVAVAAITLGLLCACSSSGSTGRSAGASTPAPSGKTAAAHPATTKAIAKAYASFFDSKASPEATERYLQHGAELASAVTAQAHNPQASGLSARVTEVTLLSRDSAAVRFELLSGGKPLLTDTPGNAVREDGRWKVAAKTFCGLVQLTGHPPAACNDPKITALPK